MPRIKKSWDEPVTRRELVDAIRKSAFEALTTDFYKNSIKVNAVSVTSLVEALEGSEDSEELTKEEEREFYRKAYGTDASIRQNFTFKALRSEEEEWEPKHNEHFFTFDNLGVHQYTRTDGLWIECRNSLGIYQTEELAKAAFERAKKAAKQL